MTWMPPAAGSAYIHATTLGPTGIADAVPDAAFTVVRLTAPMDVLEERVRRREIGTGARDQLRRTARQVEEIAAADPPGTLVVDTAGMDVAQVAARVLALWPAVS